MRAARVWIRDDDGHVHVVVARRLVEEVGKHGRVLKIDDDRGDHWVVGWEYVVKILEKEEA